MWTKICAIAFQVEIAIVIVAVCVFMVMSILDKLAVKNKYKALLKKDQEMRAKQFAAQEAAKSTKVDETLKTLTEEEKKDISSGCEPV